ncbi:serine/threonine-protein kinase BSK3-like isoform X3 [Pyrus communis]|uniref:serine/threonine-protein kinase BSK3-like isoform X3 n=1 Tax=Pyrus communis TaxID=23211 RepID=UPI0035BFB5D2
MGVQCSKLIPCCLNSHTMAAVLEAPDIDDEEKSKVDNLPAFCEFTFEQLKNATSGFAVEYTLSEQVEKAPNVDYKGKLENQKRIAVKRFNRMTWPECSAIFGIYWHIKHHIYLINEGYVMLELVDALYHDLNAYRILFNEDGNPGISAFA